MSGIDNSRCSYLLNSDQYTFSKFCNMVKICREWNNIILYFNHLEAWAKVIFVNRQNKTIKKKIIEKEIKKKNVSSGI